jgi:hypothetical protein
MVGVCLASGKQRFPGVGMSWVTVIPILTGVAGMLISALVFRQTSRKDIAGEGVNKGVLVSDVGYIKAGVDDLKRENREFAQRLSGITERLTRCEESLKQAHKRVDTLKGE